MDIMPIDRLRIELSDRSVSKVARATGLSRTTIINIRDGTNNNPSYATLLKLSEYFQAKNKDAIDG